MKLLISPADVCLLRSYERFRQIVPISSDALARRLFRILSTKLTGFGDCSASDQTEQMADVPVRLYQLLFALGYCQQVDPVGNVVPLVDKKTGVARCAPPTPYAPRKWQWLGRGNRDWERQRAMLDANGHHYRELAAAYREWARHGVGTAGYLDEDKRQKIRDKALAYKRQLKNAILAQEASHKYRKVDDETGAKERSHLLEMARKNLANHGIDAEKMLLDLDHVQADQAELHHDALYNRRFRGANASTARASILREDPARYRLAEIQEGRALADGWPEPAVAFTHVGVPARTLATETDQDPPVYWSPAKKVIWQKVAEEVRKQREALEQKQKAAKQAMERAKLAVERQRGLVELAQGNRNAADLSEERFRMRSAELEREEQAAKEAHALAEAEHLTRKNEAQKHEKALKAIDDIDPQRQDAAALLEQYQDPKKRRQMLVAELEWAQEYSNALEAVENAKTMEANIKLEKQNAGQLRAVHAADASSIEKQRHEAIERHVAAQREFREAEAQHEAQVREHEKAERLLEAHRQSM